MTGEPRGFSRVTAGFSSYDGEFRLPLVANRPHLGLCPEANVPLQGRQGSRGCIPDAPGETGIHLEWKQRTPLCSRVATGISWSSLGGLKGVKPPEAFGERSRDWSLGHAGDEGPHLSMTGESRGCSRAAAPVCGFSRGTTARGIWPRDVLKKVSRGLSRVEAGNPGFPRLVQTPIAGSLQTGDRRVRPRLGLRHGTPLASRDVPGERGRLSSCIWNLGFFPNDARKNCPFVLTSFTGWSSERCPGIGFLSRGDREIGVLRNVEPPTRPRLECLRETGLILRCDRKVGNPFQTKQGSRPSCPDQEGRKGSEEGVPENLSVPLEGDRDFGELCGSHQGCQVPFRPPIPNVGLLLRRCSGKGLHLAMTGEPRGFSRVTAGFSSYDGEFRLPLVLAQASPIFHSSCEGKLGIALE
ncbi:unnamed protein product [Wuchereria bancrofti]|uniref:Uncharacterized protein n=3 Tax=cellular organisms TaxID=131567 RepID=A0A3P7G5I9_WUCBA|nr:unnamed protein product [Wuchereria bancrofti]